MSFSLTDIRSFLKELAEYDFNTSKLIPTYDKTVVRVIHSVLFKMIRGKLVFEVIRDIRLHNCSQRIPNSVGHATQLIS